jgi:heterodisulfide reductase subunit B
MAKRQTANTKTLAQIIEEEIGDNVYLCYQCIKCTSGCPLAEHFDLTPNQVMRSVQLNEESVLESEIIWLCASCQTCTSRCPQGLDIAGVMDTLRIEAQSRGIPAAIPEVAKFSNLFLRDIGIFGRLYEVGLMAGLNLSTGQLMKDMDMGIEMLKRRKLNLIPSFTRPPKKVQPVEPADNKIAYFPGCSLHSSAAEYGHTVRAVCETVGLDLVEPPGWICCGSSPAHSTDHALATVLPVTNLAIIEQMGLDEVTAPCSACYARFMTASHNLAHDDELAASVKEQVGYDYQNTVRVHHLLDTLVDRVGLDVIESHVKKPLAGLKVASYYGCLITRPAQITGAEHPEYPMKLDHLMRALGAEPIDWSYKTDCCGGSLGLTQTPLALEMTERILRNARDCGADVVATMCPLCHVNLDARQSQLDIDFKLPILYGTQLVALAFGLDEKTTAFQKNLVDPRPLLKEKLAIASV